MLFKCSLLCFFFVTPQLVLHQLVRAKNPMSAVEHAERKIAELETFLADPERHRVHSLQGELIVAALHVVAADEFLGRPGSEDDRGLPSVTVERMQKVLQEALGTELHPREERAVRAVLEVMQEGAADSCKGELEPAVQF
jgi:hypothetical protein